MRNICVEVVYLAGSAKAIVDQESRTESDSSDWMLEKSIFDSIVNIWSANIDLFETVWNEQLPCFISWRPQPNAFAVNAFGVNLGNGKVTLSLLFS